MDSYETDFPELEPEQPSAQADWNAFYDQKKPAKEKKKGGAGKIILCSVLILTLVAAGCGITAYSVNHFWSVRYSELRQTMVQMDAQIQNLKQEIKDNSFTGNGNSISGSVNTSAEGMTPGQLYAKCVKSVVAISTNKATGSGFILSEDGFVVTNYHVVEDGTSLTVTTYDGTEYAAVLRGYDSANDVAVLKIEAQGLSAATLGSSDDLIIGDQVAAIGNPLGELTSTLTVGYVSAKDRAIATDGTLMNMLQTDAAINSGNSGGPLFNMKGEVVGITTAKYSGTTSSGATIEGIGFAIPIDDVAKKISDLVELGYVTGAYLGVSVNSMDKTTANHYGLPMGVYVQSVTAGSCAETAGVKPKDIITALGDTVITDLNGLTRALQNFKAGDTSTITVWRGGVTQTFSITFDEKPHTTVESAIPSGSDSTMPNFWDHFFGN